MASEILDDSINDNEDNDNIEILEVNSNHKLLCNQIIIFTNEIGKRKNIKKRMVRKILMKNQNQK